MEKASRGTAMYLQKIPKNLKNEVQNNICHIAERLLYFDILRQFSIHLRIFVFACNTP